MNLPASRRVQSFACFQFMTDGHPRKLIIAIDGPAGAGKSTIASRLARKLGYANLESGAMYRALALRAILTDTSFDDEDALVQLARDAHIQLEPAATANRVLLNSQDVTHRIRETDVTEGASRVSVHPKVRAWMVPRQQELGAERRRGDGRPRHWNESFSARRRENFPRRRSRGARAAPITTAKLARRSCGSERGRNSPARSARPHPRYLASGADPMHWFSTPPALAKIRCWKKWRRWCAKRCKSKPRPRIHADPHGFQ